MYQWHAHSGVVVIQSLNRVQMTLESVPIELHFYSRPVVVAPLLVPTRPDPPPPPHRPPVTSPLSSPEFPPLETLRNPPTQSCTLVLSPSLAAPPDTLGAGNAHPVSGSETSLTARLRRAPANAWLAAPDSA